MPEGSNDAVILIATSWQALNRAIKEDSGTLICDCTVLILFAGFYIESNLNYLISELKMETHMHKFFGNKNPSMQEKLSWFYNEFVAKSKASTKKQLKKSGIYKKLRKRFPGYAKVHQFRNDISHGKINQSAKSLEEALQLRQQAKDIVGDLFNILLKAGHTIPKAITYDQAIQNMLSKG